MTPKFSSQRGNIFFTLFAAVAVVGALGVGTSQLLKGPVAGMVRNNQVVATEDRAELNLKLMTYYRTAGGVGDADCDADGTMEPLAWTAAGGLPAPVNGGLIPTHSSFKLQPNDPWGTQYGYCGWDGGTQIQTTCGNPTLRLKGSPSSINTPFMALISAGPDKKFQTTCADFVDTTPADGVPDNVMLSKTVGSDDIIYSYTYQEMQAAMGDNWVFTKDTGDDGDTLKTNQNLQFGQDVNFGGVLDLNKMGAGLTLSDKAGAVCGTDTEGHLFTDSSVTPPSLVMCKSGVFEPVGGAGGGGTIAPVAGFTPNMPNCTATNQGPFVQAGQIAIANAGGIWGDGKYIYNAANAGGLYAYTFDGTTFTQNANAAFTGDKIWGDGTYIYVVSSTGLRAYTFNGTTLTLKGTYTVTGGTAVWGDGTYIYYATGSSGKIYVLTFDGTNFTDNYVSQFGASWAITGRNGNVYTLQDTVAGHVRVLPNPLTPGFNTTTIYPLMDAFPLALTTDPNYIYAGYGYQEVGFHALAHMNSGTATRLGFYDTNNNYPTAAWSDGYMLYAGVGTKLLALYFDGTNFTKLSEMTLGGSIQSIWGDGNYIYVGASGGGMYAFSGFECLGTKAASAPSQTISPELDVSLATYSWGNGDTGKFGDGTSVDGAYMHRVKLNGLIQINSYNDAACGVRGDGTGWCWGTESATYQNFGNGSISGLQPNPSQVSGISDFVKIVVGDDHACGLTKTGIAYCWGSDTSGQLGNGTTTGTQDKPSQVSNISDFVDIAAGSGYACGVRKNGEAWCWGGASRLGANLGTNQTSPVRVIGVDDFVNITAYLSATCGVARSGIAYCWGFETTGNLGNGTATTNTIPAPVQNIKDFTKVSIGGGFSCGIRKNGEAWCWGSDTNGKLGNGPALTVQQDVPSKVSDVTDFIDILAGNGSACGLRSTGQVYCWGGSTDFALGQSGGNKDVPSPTNSIGTTTSMVKSIWGNSGNVYAITQTVPEGSEPALSGNVAIRQSRSSAGASSLESHGLTITQNSTTADTQAGLGFGVDATSIAGSDRPGAQIAAYRRVTGNTQTGLRLKTSTTSAVSQGLRIFPEGGLQIDPPLAVGSSKALLMLNDRTNWNSAQFYDGFTGRTADPFFFGIDKTTGAATIAFDNNFRVNQTTATAASSTIANDKLWLNATAAFLMTPFYLTSDLSAITLTHFGNTAADGSSLKLHHSRGTYAAPSTLASLDRQGAIKFIGGGAPSDAGQASIFSRVTSAPSSNNTCSSLVFRTSDTSLTTSVADRLRLWCSGMTTVGTVTPINDYKLMVTGRMAADEGVRVGTDTVCSSAPNHGGLIRYTGTAWEVCDGSAWVPMAAGGGSACDGNYIVSGTRLANQYKLVMADGNVFNSYSTHPTMQFKKSLHGHAVDVASGRLSLTCMLNSDGDIYCTGRNNVGQLGQGWVAGDSADYPPAKISSNKKFKQVRAFTSNVLGRACGLTTEGGAQCWGSGGSYTLGYGGTADSSIPMDVPVSNVKKIAMASLAVCFLTDAGKVMCAGLSPQAGTGATAMTPTANSLSNVVDIDAGSSSFCALLANGEVWCWGQASPSDNMFMTGTTTTYSTPTKLTGLGTNGVAIELTRYGGCLLNSDRTVSCWGIAYSGLQPISGTAGTDRFVQNDSSNEGVGTIMGIFVNGDIKTWDHYNGATTTTNFVPPFGTTCSTDRRAFVTSQTFTGNLGGVEGANAICNAAASKGNLFGTYKAWLSSNTSTPAGSMNKYNSFYRTPLSANSLIATSWTTLANGALSSALDDDEFGNSVASSFVWTGTTTAGAKESGADSAVTCRDWTSSSGSDTGSVGSSGVTTSSWTDSGNNSACNIARRLFCIQQ